MRFALLFVLLLLVRNSAGNVQSARQSDTCGLVVLAYGGSDEWNMAVRRAVAPVREQVPTSIAFGIADPDALTDAIAELERQGVACIAVVRLFMSAQSFLHQTEYFLGLREDPPPSFASRHAPPFPAEFEAEVKISQTALLDAPETGQILALNALELSDSSGTESVLMIAHGAEDDAVDGEWVQKMNLLADSVRATGLFRTVAVHSLREDWEQKRARAETEIRRFVADHSDGDGRVIVLPFRMFGFGPYAEVLEGLSYSSSGTGLLPHPKVTEWIERMTNELFAEFSQD